MSFPADFYPLLCLSFPMFLLVSASRAASSAMEPTALASPRNYSSRAALLCCSVLHTFEHRNIRDLTAEPENNPIDGMDLMFPLQRRRERQTDSFFLPAAPCVGPFDHFYFSQPGGRADNSLPEQDYLYGYLFPERTKFTRIDIQNDLRTQVVAAAPGRVIWLDLVWQMETTDESIHTAWRWLCAMILVRQIQTVHCLCALTKNVCGCRIKSKPETCSAKSA